MKHMPSAAAFAATSPIWLLPSAAAWNIPACTGFITDIGLPPPYAPMDFAGWMEVYLGGHWHAFDPLNNASRIGRVLIVYGRDAADVPLTHMFGPGTLSGFRVWAEEASAG
jgi:transglutaminase-like putative cysteine protease